MSIYFLLMLCLVKSKLKVFHVPYTNWRSQRVRVISDSAPIGAIKQMHFVIAVMYVCIRVNIPSIYIVGALFFLLFFNAFYSCVLFHFLCCSCFVSPFAIWQVRTGASEKQRFAALQHKNCNLFNENATLLLALLLLLPVLYCAYPEGFLQLLPCVDVGGRIKTP